MTDVKHNVFVLGDPHAREMLLSFPAACDTCCSLPAATLCLYCNKCKLVGVYVITGEGLPLFAPRPVLPPQGWLGLRFEEFQNFLLSLCVSLASLGVSLAWGSLGYLENKYYS